MVSDVEFLAFELDFTPHLLDIVIYNKTSQLAHVFKFVHGVWDAYSLENIFAPLNFFL